MSRTKFLAGTAIAIAIAISVAPVAAANAVTNLADNPYPITVTGDDGNTYVDGQDTLPGFDDEECTYIPGAYFDFANNRVHYADGKSIPWTEWDRATGYSAWLASKNNPKPTVSPSPSKSSSSSTTKKPNATNPQVKTTPVASASATPLASETPSAELTNYPLTYSPISHNPGRETGLAILISLAGALALTYFVGLLRKEKA